MNLTVGDRMVRDPVTVTPDETLVTAQTKMHAGGFRQLPVIMGQKLVGIITDRDIRQHGRQMRITKVNAAMTENVVTVTPATPMEEAARILLEHKIGGLPVVDRDRLVGIITITDMLRAFVDLTASPAKRVARIY
jgi:acetoin utilization protein AcuB